MTSSAKRLVRIVVLGNAAAGAEKQALALSARLRDRLRRHPAVAGGEGGDDVSCVRVPFYSDSIAHKLPPLLQVAAARLTGNAFFGYDLSGERKAQLRGGEEGGGSVKGVDGRKSPLNVVIGCGRTTVALCATLKLMARRPSDVFNIQIQHPRVPLSWFDVVVAPRHDFAPDAIAKGGDRHVHLTTGTVYDISSELLAQQAEQWREALSKYTQDRKLRVVWLIGGPCRGFAFTEQEADAMVKNFVRVLKSRAVGGNEDDDNLAVFVTFSRRTPAKVVEIIQHHLCSSFKNANQLFIWDGRGENPYYAFLDIASLIVTTPDSISMTTEAIVSTKAVFTISAERAKGKFLRFHQGLFYAKLTAPFTEDAVFASALQRSGATIAKAHSEETKQQQQLLPSEALERELSAIADAITQQIVRGM